MIKNSSRVSRMIFKIKVKFSLESCDQIWIRISLLRRPDLSFSKDSPLPCPPPLPLRTSPPRPAPKAKPFTVAHMKLPIWQQNDGWLLGPGGRGGPAPTGGASAQGWSGICHLNRVCCSGARGPSSWAERWLEKTSTDIVMECGVRAVCLIKLIKASKQSVCRFDVNTWMNKSPNLGPRLYLSVLQRRWGELLGAGGTPTVIRVSAPTFLPSRTTDIHHINAAW